MLLPDSFWAATVGVFAPILGLFAITGLYAWQKQKMGTVGLVGYILNSIGLAGFVGVAFSINYVLSQLEKPAIEEILEGPTRFVFLLVSVIFILGICTFGWALRSSGDIPQAAILLYVFGFTPRALAGVVPAAVGEVGQLVAAVGIALLGWAVYKAHADAPKQRVLPT